MESSSCNSVTFSSAKVGDNTPHIPSRRAISVIWCNIAVKSKRRLKITALNSINNISSWVRPKVELNEAQ